MNNDDQPIEDTAVRYALYQYADEAADRDEIELIVNSMVEIDGDLARVSSVRLRLGRSDREPRLVGCDRVEDELARGSDGRWTIEHRTIAGDPTRNARHE